MKKLLILLIVCLTIPAHADMGPKPQITVFLENAPRGEIYVDLLREFSFSEPLKNRDKYDQQMLEALEAYDTDGWRPMLTNGVPLLFGTIDGRTTDTRTYYRKNERVFSYFSTPERFKIIAVDEKCKIVVSDILERKTMHVTVRFDMATGKAQIEDSWDPLW